MMLRHSYLLFSAHEREDLRVTLADMNESLFPRDKNVSEDCSHYSNTNEI